ncbi:MAG TPA: protein kinase, partial [Candidatus Polarisedimenticolia bacterium]|nr:protein kinase [Candidatus Polarisedimenticolia bacterium]
MAGVRFTQEQIVEAVRELEAGADELQLCRRLGIDLDTLHAWKKRHGAPPDNSVANAPTETVPPADAPKEIFGPYRLLQKLGEGGMGEVWLAEQTEPIRRKVAIKLIKAGMDTKQVIARFEAERQALALMDHPGIAKVFDAGETPRGLPYFAMEYVAGEAITTYCDRHRLSVPERLELFARACDAVQHAHQKGVIHRDLKPSNVMVTLQGDKPAPKIIDFGVAKATAQRLTERTMFTELGVLIGTPEYMSPEQAEMTGLDVDTRTDVYALGVMLYELLTGALPFEPRDLRQAGFEEVRRRIREIDPPRPSTRVRTLGAESTQAASDRRTDPARLASRLKGDLDWIVMKALEKDRTRRYGSASDLAADVERHLQLQPVLAGPPGASYRTKKFVRRHRLGVTMASAIVMGMAALSVVMVAQARKTARARDRAERVSGFLVDLFRVSDPGTARGNAITAREVLDRGAERIDKELGNEPEVQAQLMVT